MLTTLPIIAQIVNPVVPPRIGTGSGAPIVGSIIGAVMGVLLIFGFLSAIFYFILGAHKWITSTGDKGKLTEAREQITQAMVGLLLMVSVWAVLKVISAIIGFDLTRLPLPVL